MFESGRPWKEVATVIAGISSRAREAVRGDDFRVVHVADIVHADDGTYELRRLRLACSRPHESAVRAGDIVMAARGFVACAAVAPHSWDGALLSSNVVSIRPTGLLDADVLLFLLGTKEARGIYERRSGSGALMLSPRSFDSLHIPVPDASRQAVMSELLRLRRREATLVARLIERRARMVNAMLLRSVTESANGGTSEAGLR